MSFNYLITDFRKLKPQFEAVLTARYIDNLSYKSIAKKLNIPLGTVRSRLARGKEKLDFDINYLFKE